MSYGYRAYKFKLYQNKKNKYLHECIDIACDIWNYGIKFADRYYKLYNHYITGNKLKKWIARVKHTKYQNWEKLNAKAAQIIIERLDKEYLKFFKSCREAEEAKRKNKRQPNSKAKHPSQKKYSYFHSILLTTSGYKLHPGTNRVTLMKRTYKYSKSREIEGQVVSVMIKRNQLGELFLIVTVYKDLGEKPQRRENVIGLDFGLKHFITMDNGDVIDSPRYALQYKDATQKALARINRCVDGSNNKKRAYLHYVRISEKIKNSRQDWLLKLAHYLTRRYSVICIETLDLVKIRKQNGSIVNDLAWGKFRSALMLVAPKNGAYIQPIDKYQPTSKQCNICGHIKKGLKPNERSLVCPVCGSIYDRDVNAAKNIKEIGWHEYLKKHKPRRW